MPGWEERVAAFSRMTDGQRDEAMDEAMKREVRRRRKGVKVKPWPHSAPDGIATAVVFDFVEPLTAAAKDRMRLSLRRLKRRRAKSRRDG